MHPTLITLKNYDLELTSSVIHRMSDEEKLNMIIQLDENYKVLNEETMLLQSKMKVLL